MAATMSVLAVPAGAQAVAAAALWGSRVPPTVPVTTTIPIPAARQRDVIILCQIPWREYQSRVKIAAPTGWLQSAGTATRVAWM
jgi:hypothetical protein